MHSSAIKTTRAQATNDQDNKWGLPRWDPNLKKERKEKTTQNNDLLFFSHEGGLNSDT